MKEDEDHHVAHIKILRAVENNKRNGTQLVTSSGTLTIQELPPLGEHRVVNVLLDGS